MEILTERLRLVPISPAYIDDIFVNFTSEITRYMYPKPAEKKSETEEFVRRGVELAAQGIEQVFAVTKKTDGEFLGCMGIHHLDTLTPVLGLWIKKSAHGHAYGLEGMNGLIDYAFGHLRFHHLVYDVDKDNYPSRRIPQLHGGVIRREYVRYGASGNQLNLVEYWLYKDPAEALKIPPVLLFQGDSITDANRDRSFMYGLGEGYPKFIQSDLPGCIVLNRGISGNRTIDLLERWETDAIALKPDFLCLLIGINEVWHHYMFNRILTPEQFEKYYRQLLDRIKTKLPKTRIMLIEPFVFPIGVWEPCWQTDLDAEKKIVRQLASEYADYFLPMDDLLHEKAKTLSYAALLGDGVHPTELGHKVIAEAILSVLGPLYH